MLDSESRVRQSRKAESRRSSLSLREMESLRRSLFLFARHRLRDPADAEDVAQETLLRFLAARHHLREPTECMAYLLGIARHVISDTSTDHGREFPVEPSRCERWPAPESLRPADPLSGLLLQERAAAVHRAVDRLPELQRDVVEACVIGDKSCAELAEETGEPSSRLRKRKSRAVRRLRRDLYAAV